MSLGGLGPSRFENGEKGLTKRKRERERERERERKRERGRERKGNHPRGGHECIDDCADGD